MKTRFAAPRWFCLTLLATLSLGSSARADQRPILPQWQKAWLSYKGKTFDQWKNVLLSEIDPRERLEKLKPMTIFARHGMEEEVVTTILTLMREYDYGFLSLDEEIEAQQALGEVMRTEEEKDEDAVFDECEKIVKKIGPAAAIPVLRQWLSGANRGACFFALMVLSEDFGQASREAIPDILELTRDEDYRIVADAYLSLSCIEKNDAKLLEYLRPGLQHKSGEVRATILDAITSTGSECVKSAAPEILKALEDGDARVCAAAAWAAIQAELGAKAVPAMIKLIQRDDAETQYGAYFYLRLLGPAAKDAVPALIDILKKAPHSTKTRQFLMIYRQKSDVPAPASEPIPAPGKKMMPGSQPAPEPVPVPVPMRSDSPAPPPAKEPTWSRADLGDELPLGRQKFGSGDFIRDKVPFDEFAEAIGVLLAIGPEAREAVPVLRELLKTASSKHQDMIHVTLESLERRPADAVPDSKQSAPVPLPPAKKASKSTRPANLPAQRTPEVYRLTQAPAPDVAVALQTYITNEMSMLGNQANPYLPMLRNVVVTPEPISNSLILGGSPQELKLIKALIRAIDVMPPADMTEHEWWRARYK